MSWATVALKRVSKPAASPAPAVKPVSPAKASRKPLADALVPLGLPARWLGFDIVTLDFETFFSKEYTLKKLNTSDYIRDPRFRAHMVSIKRGTGKTKLILHRDIPAELASIDWSRTLLLCHNTAFDGLILQHHYGVVPAAYLDTLSMARALHGNAIRADLDTVARFYGKGNKLEDVLMRTQGIEDLELPEHKELLLKTAAYCIVDTDLCHDIFWEMAKKLPSLEFELIHYTINMFANPVLEIDLQLAAEARDEEIARREALFKKCIPDEAVTEWRAAHRGKADRELTDHQVRAKLLRKDAFYADMLREFGVEPPRKWSTKQDKMVESFSKDLLVALQEAIQPDAEDGEDLYDLLQARIDANSTITVTRAERLINLGKNGWKAPVGYNYYRAVTGRWGGANKCNFQNFSRGGKLRRSIRAQRGYVLPVIDSSQIEARTLAWIAGADWKLAVFRAYDVVIGAKHKKTGEFKPLKGDPDVFLLNLTNKDDAWEPVREGPDNYRVAYATSFKLPVDQVTKEQRQIGKVQELALGYRGAVGAFNSMARNYGMKMPENEVRRVVQAWRRANKEIVAFWAACEDVLHQLCRGKSGRFGRDNVLEYGVWNNLPQIKLPNGMTLKYPGLRAEMSVDKFGRERLRHKYDTAEGPKDIYDGLVCENITQALARIVVGYQSLELARQERWVMTTHDEGVFHVPTSRVKAFYLHALKVFRTPPSWAADLPVNGDGGWAREYSK